VRSVQVDQQGAQPFQEGERDRGVVHECLSASRRLDDPAQDELAVVARLQSVLRQHVVDGRRPVETEGRFHDALRLPSADGRRVGPFAQQQGEGSDQDGFAGAGFARDDVQSRLELNAGFFHQGQVPHSQQRQHGRQDSAEGAGRKARIAAS